MAVISCIIVEDEPLAREILSQFIQQIPDLELLGECPDIHEARKLLKEVQPDLLFLDIHMPEGTGISLLKSLVCPPRVIFTTAHSEFAVQGFDLNAIDYLLKPFSFERFQQAIEKARKELNSPLTPGFEGSIPEFLTLKVEKRWVKIEFKDILFLQGFGNYVKVHTPEKVWLTKETLKALGQKLPEQEFLQVHKSYLCRVRAINYLEGNQLNIGEHLIPVGARYKADLMQAMNF